jgi:hypothetical protein
LKKHEGIRRAVGRTLASETAVLVLASPRRPIDDLFHEFGYACSPRFSGALSARAHRFHGFWARLFPRHYPQPPAGGAAGARAGRPDALRESGPLSASRPLCAGGVGLVMRRHELLEESHRS